MLKSNFDPDYKKKKAAKEEKERKRKEDEAKNPEKYKNRLPQREEIDQSEMKIPENFENKKLYPIQQEAFNLLMAIEKHYEDVEKQAEKLRRQSSKYKS